MTVRSRPALLLLHGTAPGTTADSNFAHLRPALTEYEVLAPDLLGFGDSPKSSDTAYGPQLWVDQATNLLGACGGSDVVVVGNSMGARVALSLAALMPEQIRGLVLMSARLHPSTSPAQELIRSYHPDRDAMAELLRECFATDPATVTPEMVEARYLASALPGAHEALQTFFAALPSAGPGLSRPQLQALEVPALVIAGRGDRVVPYSNSIELAGLLPRADVHILGGTGHWLQIERAKTFTALLKDFIEGLS